MTAMLASIIHRMTEEGKAKGETGTGTGRKGVV
jgi:hypothetical protein